VVKNRTHRRHISHTLLRTDQCSSHYGVHRELPSMLVLFTIMGKKQAVTYIIIVMILSAFAGLSFGSLTS
jgi:hypothetical protein